MPRYEFSAADLAAAIAGPETYAQIAERYGCTPSAVLMAARRMGVAPQQRPPQKAAEARRKELTPDVIRRYQAGDTPRRIAAALECSEGLVRRCLDEAGVAVRSVVEAAKLRLSKESEEHRRAANAKRSARLKGRPGVPSTYLLSAVTKARTLTKVGRFEEETCTALADRGVRLVQQVPVHTFNLDLAAWPFAVEVHASGSHPRSVAGLRRRDEMLKGLGWSVAYLWIAPGKQPSDAAFDKLAQLDRDVREFFQSPGNWIVRHDGSFDCDNQAVA